MKYPAFWGSSNSWQSDSFDFKSIMLYSGLKVKPDKISLNDGKLYTVLNTKLSEKDIEMINKMY